MFMLINIIGKSPFYPKGGSTWGTKSGASHSGAGAPSANSEILSEDEEEEGAPVPEFKHAFSDAIARAFDSAVLKPSGKDSLKFFFMQIYYFYREK